MFPPHIHRGNDQDSRLQRWNGQYNTAADTIAFTSKGTVYIQNDNYKGVNEADTNYIYMVNADKKMNKVTCAAVWSSSTYTSSFWLGIYADKTSRMFMLHHTSFVLRLSDLMF